MNYFVKRGTEELGPYSLADLQQAVNAGKVSLGDLARSEGMNDWAMVSQVVGTIPVPAAPYGVAAAPALAPVQTVDLPPNLHWGFVLIFLILWRVNFLLGIFNVIWAMILANWARKLDGNNNTLVLIAMYPAAFVSIFVIGMIAGLTRQGPSEGIYALAGLMIIAGAISYLIGIFKIKSAMEEYYNSTENIGLSLSGVMTFFFSTIYLQYHVNQIAKRKKEGTMNLSYS